jgi:hypothetical protein
MTRGIMNRVTLAMAGSALALRESGGAHEAPVAGSPARGLSAAALAVAYVASYGNTTHTASSRDSARSYRRVRGHLAGGLVR